MSRGLRLALIGLVLPAMVAPAMADCTDEVLGILHHANEAGAYRLKMSSVIDGLSFSSYSEAVPGQGMKTVNRLDGAVSEFIVIGDRGWENLGDGWLAMSSSVAAAMAKGVAEANFLASEVLDAACEGEVERDGLTLRQYGFRLPDGPGVLVMLVEPETGLPVEIRLSHEGATPTVMKFVFDPTITLAPPPGF